MERTALGMGQPLSPVAAWTTPDLDGAGFDALEFLAQRYSVGPKHLTLPAPDAQALQRAARVALRAPDHRHLQPFRFVQVADEQRCELARLFAQDAARRGHGADEVERARERAHNGPALLGVVGRVGPNETDVPESEQWICIGAGLMNFLNAMHLMGFGAKVLSGASVRDESIRDAFCEPGETLVAWLLVGTPSARSRPKAADDVGRVLTAWRGTGAKG
ncbi:MAG: nitroreductase [Methylibium sp.]